MELVIEYAPIILLIIGFLIAYNVFITPQQLSDKLEIFETKLDEKFVHKEAHAIVISEMKEDIKEIKDKIDKIYERIMECSHHGGQ